MNQEKAEKKEEVPMLVIPVGIDVEVRDGLLGIRDDLADMLNITEKVRTARVRIRDDLRRITWVHDRLQGLVPYEQGRDG